MSLKSFHLFFIATVLGLMAFCARWAAGEGSKGLLAVSAFGFLGGLSYLRWFLRKYRALR